jgi:hypothetical protein
VLKTPTVKSIHLFASTSLQFKFSIMSWQDYVDKSLLGTGLVSKAAIHGHNGGAWATSAGFAVRVLH